ncbi:MAG: hypothetical protein ACM3PW_11485 [Chlamydiota bacterium]
MHDKDLAERMEAVERLTKLFQLERMVNLGANTVALIMLLGSAGIMIFQRQAGAAELTMMFGSSGLIAYSTGRLLYMWNQALRLIAPQPEGGVDEPRRSGP